MEASEPASAPLDVAAIREDFPILQREFEGNRVVYAP